MAEGNRTPPHKEGVDIPSAEAVAVWHFITNKGEEHLADSAFVKGGDFADDDIQAMKNYYQEVLEYQEKEFGEKGAVFNRSLREHIGLVERLAEKAAPLLGLDENLMKAVALTHDLGRLFSHRRGRNNVIESALIKKVGFSKEFSLMLPPDVLWTDVSQESITKRLQSATTKNGGITGAIELFDVLAKWKNKDEGTLRKKDDISTKAQKAQHLPNAEDMWPSELTRQKMITSSEGDHAIENKYSFLAQWFREKTGVDVDDFVSNVEQSLVEHPISPNWTS